MGKSHYVWAVAAGTGISKYRNLAYGHGYEFDLFIPFGNGVLVGSRKDAENLRRSRRAAWRRDKYDPGEYVITRVPIIALAVVDEAAYRGVIGTIRPGAVSVGDPVPDFAQRAAMKYFGGLDGIYMRTSASLMGAHGISYTMGLVAGPGEDYSEMVSGMRQYPKTDAG